LHANEYLIDMGTPEKYERAQREWPTAVAASTIALKKKA
jgi:NDP-sugar pyrophosphorylase family protein